jgi:hypothetical protein
VTALSDLSAAVARADEVLGNRDACNLSEEAALALSERAVTLGPLNRRHPRLYCAASIYGFGVTPSWVWDYSYNNHAALMAVHDIGFVPPHQIR